MWHLHLYRITCMHAPAWRANAVSVRAHYCRCWGAPLLWKHVCMHQVTSEVTRRAFRSVSNPPVPLPTTGNSSQVHLVLFPVCTCGLKPLMSVFAHADAPMPTFSHRIQKVLKKVWKCIQKSSKSFLCFRNIPICKQWSRNWAGFTGGVSSKRWQISSIAQDCAICRDLFRLPLPKSTLYL